MLASNEVRRVFSAGVAGDFGRRWDDSIYFEKDSLNFPTKRTLGISARGKTEFPTEFSLFATSKRLCDLPPSPVGFNFVL